MSEYAVDADRLLSSNFASHFNFDSIQGVALIAMWGVALLGIGFLIKGFWGAVITLLAGSFLLLYFKGLLPI